MLPRCPSICLYVQVSFPAEVDAALCHLGHLICVTESAEFGRFRSVRSIFFSPTPGFETTLHEDVLTQRARQMLTFVPIGPRRKVGPKLEPLSAS